MTKGEAMTPEDVQARLDALESISGDDESAHGEEDELHRDVLAAIRDGTPNPQRLAELALKTTEISFSRWYA